MSVSYRTLPTRVLEAHGKVSENYRWIRDNLVKLREDYPDEFIAVSDRRVVYHTKVYSDLLKYLSEKRDHPDLIASRLSADKVLLR